MMSSCEIHNFTKSHTKLIFFHFQSSYTLKANENIILTIASILIRLKPHIYICSPNKLLHCYINKIKSIGYEVINPPPFFRNRHLKQATYVTVISDILYIYRPKIDCMHNNYIYIFLAEYYLISSSINENVIENKQFRLAYHHF